MDFGAKLKELREQAGLSQKQLAEKAGVGQHSVSNWEQGIRDPSWPNVVALCQALGVDCTEFMAPPTAKPAAKRGRPKKT